MLFKPASKVIALSNKNGCSIGGNFKMLEGQLIKGSVTPPLEGCKVTVQRLTTKNIKTPQPFIIETDSNGQFQLGPIEKDTYSVTIEKDDFIFTRTNEDSPDFGFIAKQTPRLDVKVIDDQGNALSDVVVSCSAGTYF
jgi:hypothetical protein